MKQYKLKKDLPTFKAGGIFHINAKGNLVSDNELSKGIVAYSKSTLDKFPSILTDWYEEYEERDPLAKEAFVKYLKANPEQRLMQAVYNFIEQELNSCVTCLLADVKGRTEPEDTWLWECDKMMLEMAGSKAEEPEFTTFEAIEKRKKLNQMKSRLKEWAENNDVTDASVYFSALIGTGDKIVRFRNRDDWDTVIEIIGWPREGLEEGKDYSIEALIDKVSNNKQEEQ